jgi:hypothetical protein
VRLRPLRFRNCEGVLNDWLWAVVSGEDGGSGVGEGENEGAVTGKLDARE